MAASAAAAGSSPGLCPNYAVICSFLERYGALLDLPELTFSQLERYLLDTSAVPKLLVDLHVKLLRKIGKSVSADRWEKYLVKVCQEFNTTWAWELEKKGYKELTVECKTGILKYLCECQFDDNVKFKTAINEEDPDKMRLQPIGRDKDGLMYWFQLDQDNNVRVYVEEQDDLDGSSWKCIVRERNELAEILALLKTQIDPALLTKKDQEEGPSPEDGENKKKGEEGGVKKTEDTSEDEDDKPPKDTVCSVSAEMENKEKAAQKEDSKLNVLDAKSPSSGIQDNQTDSASTVQSEKPVADDKVTINNQTIKEEPMEVSESKEATATSATEPPTEKQCGALQTEQAEEVRRKTAEELQRAMKNDQQAKIPLKKREMKLSEDFDNTSGSSSSIIVRNPSILPVKEAPKVEEINKEVSVASVGIVKELKSDHVNGDTQPATETTFNNGLRESPKEMGAQEDSAERKEQQTKAIAGEGSIAVESVAKETTNLPLDKKVIKDVDEEKNVASNSEETKDVTMSDEISPQKNIPAMKAEKESTDIPEEVKTTAPKVAKAPSTSTAEPLPLCKDAASPSEKDAASPSEKSTECKEEDKLNVSKEINVMMAPIDDNTSTSKETHKIPSPDNSRKLDGVQGTDSLVASKEVKLDAPKETEKIVVPKDTDTSVVKEMEKPAVTEKQSDSKNTEITVITKETGRLDPITEKPDDKPTESPAVVKKTEKPSSNKAGTENVDGPQKTETSLVIKKTEIPEQMKDSENLGSLKETKTSSVIKKADKPSFNKDTEKLDSTKETDKSSVIKKMEQKGASKRIEKCGDPEDTVVSSIIKEKPVVTAADTKVIAEEKETPVLEKDSEKSVTCKDTEKTGVAEVNEKSVTCKDTEKTGVAEVNEKSVPKDVEMVAVTEKLTHPQLDESKKVKKLATAKDTETVSKEMEKSSCPKGEKSDTTKETKKQADTKSGDAKEVVKLATNEDAKQLPSPKNAASGKGDQEEPMEVSLEKSTDESIKTQADVDQESKKVVKSGEKCEPNKQEQDTNKEKLEHTNHLPTETDGDKEIKSDSTVEKMEDGKEDKQEKDDKNRTTAEECDDAKVSEGSAGDKPNDEGEKRDAETTGKGAAGGGEVSSEIQEEGIRLKIRIPTHRRKSDLQREERRGDSESDTGEGRSLRRSPRICRPTAKGVEFQDRRIEKKQATPPVEKGEEEEEEEEEEEKAVQKKPREKKVDQEGQPKAKGKRRRRTRWSNTRTRSRKKKGSGEDDDDDDDESSQEESEEDDSDEDFKVERGKNRRRNRNRERRSSDSSTSSDDLPPNDDPCKHCGLPNHPELILLCDSCDNGYHTACLRPPLMIIPDGEWFCPPCQHKLLCDKLEEQLLNLDAALKKKERAERRKERLVYVGISLENIIDPSVELDEEKQEEEVVVKKEKKEVKKGKSWGRRSTRTKKCISYRFDEFDEAIEEAIEEDIKEAEGGGAGRGKDMANITGHRGKDMSVIMQAEEGKENGGPPRPSAGQRRKKRRRLNDLDSDSTMEEEESEDEFRISDSSEEEFVVSENDAESEAEAGSNNDSDFGSSGDGRRCRTSRSKRPSKRRRSTRQPRKRRRPRGYSDDEEEETDEEEEEEIATEGSSEYSDSDLDMSRRRSRRSQKKQVNYCETSESEGSKAGTNRGKVTARRRFASSDSEASPAKDSDDEEKERTVKRRADSSEEESKQRRRRISLKRRRASEDDDDDDSDSDESEEEERPVRKRVNRIDSDDDDDDDEEKEEEKEKKVVAEKEDEEGSVLGKGTSPLDYNLVELPPTNGQNPMKGLEGLAVGAPGLMTQLGPKNVSTTPAVAVAPNGLVSQEMAPQDDDEDDLLGVTDLVDYVCNSEQL